MDLEFIGIIGGGFIFAMLMFVMKKHELDEYERADNELADEFLESAREGLSKEREKRKTEFEFRVEN